LCRYAAGYEEVQVPAGARAPIGEHERAVAIEDLDEWAQLAFDGMKSLNRIQVGGCTK
jgi:activating signal cointegrator complex subunit 3